MSAAEQTIASLRYDGSEIIAVVAAMLGLAICSVALRLLAKSTNTNEYGFDDALVGCSLASYIASESLIMAGMFLSSPS